MGTWVTSYKLAETFFIFLTAYKVTICGDATENPTYLCVQHSPPLPYECTLESVSKVAVSSIMKYIDLPELTWVCTMPDCFSQQAGLYYFLRHK